MKKQRKYPEFELQKAVCKFLDLQYPDVDYDTDTIASVSLTVAQASRNKQVQKAGFHRPDLMIYAARGGYHGLLIELKVTSPFKKNGELKKNDHLEKQLDTINRLREQGYCAGFSWRLDQVMYIINVYMNGHLTALDGHFYVAQ